MALFFFYFIYAKQENRSWITGWFLFRFSKQTVKTNSVSWKCKNKHICVQVFRVSLKNLKHCKSTLQKFYSLPYYQFYWFHLFPTVLLVYQCKLFWDVYLMNSCCDIWDLCIVSCSRFSLTWEFGTPSVCPRCRLSASAPLREELDPSLSLKPYV